MMSIVIVDNIKELYKTLEKFFSECVIEVHKINQLGLIDYLKDSRDKLYFNEGDIQFGGKPMNRFNVRIPIEYPFNYTSMNIILENSDSMLTSCHVLHISSPEYILFNEQRIGSEDSRITIRNITFETYSYSVVKKLGTEKVKVSGKYISEIVFKKHNSKFGGYIVLNESIFMKQELFDALKLITSSRFSGKFSWCIKGVKNCPKKSEYVVKNAIGLHIMYVAKDIDEKVDVYKKVYRLLKSNYDSESIFKSNGIDNLTTGITKQDQSIIIELKIPVEIFDEVDEEFFEQNNAIIPVRPNVIVRAKVKIDFDIGNINCTLQNK